MTRSKDSVKAARLEALAAYARKHRKKAVRLLTPLAEQGDLESQVALWEIFYYGLGDESQASYWLGCIIAQAENGSVDAKWNLYNIYEWTDLAGETWPYWLLAAANSGHPEAMFELSLKYRLGDKKPDGSKIFTIDVKKADYWLDQSVAHQYPFALTFKSFFYFDEYGIPTKKAIRLLKIADALGGVSADADIYLQRVSLILLGFRTPDGRWTGKLGVTSREELWKNEEAWQIVLSEVRRFSQLPIDRELQKWLDKKITTPIGKITVSARGLIAASHAAGKTAVMRYFQWLDQNKGKPPQVKPAANKQSFEKIEKSLQRFQSADY